MATILQARRRNSSLCLRLTENIKSAVANKLEESRLEHRDGIAAVERSDVHLGPLIGHGSQAEVYLVKYQDESMAMKSVKLRTFLTEENDGFVDAAAALALEAHFLASFDHPNIIALKGWTSQGISSYSQGRHDAFFLLLERISETLEDRLDKWKSQEVKDDLEKAERVLEQLNICAQLADALNYLHEHGVIYRDLKPSNIGFDKDGNLKLFDFGSSREIPEMTLEESFEMTGGVGNRFYRSYTAPEVVASKPYNLSSDVYSYSMICYEVMTLEQPYSKLEKQLFLHLVCEKGARPDLSKHPFPRGMRTFLKSCWCPEPHRRLCSANVLHKIEKLTKRQVTVVKQVAGGDVVIDFGKDFALANKLNRDESGGSGSTTGSVDSLDEVYFV